MRKKTSSNITPQSKRASRFSVDLGFPMMFCVIEAIVLLTLITVLNLFIKNDSNSRNITIITIALSSLYIFSAGLICLLYLLKARKPKKARYDAAQIETEVYDLFRYIIDLPYAIIDNEGKVKIMNGALQDILGYKNAVSGIDLSEFCSVSLKNIISSAKNRSAYLHETIVDKPRELGAKDISISKLADGKRYKLDSYVFKIRGENYYFIVFDMIEDYLSALEREEREGAVIAYIILDNLQELTQYVRADYRSASTEVENLLKSWITSMKGFMREYENDKYVAVFSKAELDKQMQNEFSIQQKVMNLKVGDNSFPITISMGIAAIKGTFKEKEKAAFEALNIAIRRGGNQVAVKREGAAGYIYFGGTHKTIEHNTAIVSRVSGEILEKKIRASSNVLIMGHTNPDFDSIASTVGMARFSLSVIADEYRTTIPAKRPKVNIIMDKNNDNFSICASQLSSISIYDDIFISKDAAQDLVTEDTVLIICDVNNIAIYEAPELVSCVPNIAVLDHHRLASALTFDPFLQYVETTKSSASEIVAEILYLSQFSATLRKEEAEVLLSGIMLDTNNFTRNAGAQTFVIAHYLYSRGAHTEVSREFFNENLDELLLTGEFESKARIYRDNIAITWMTLTRTPLPEDRIVASKVADKLLKVKGVQASFALIKLENDVIISGRSKGSINVQLILERLKGGGHFDIAGAQVRNSSLTKTCEMLKDAIDDYFEFDHRRQVRK